jgi:hypothetical protein
MLGYPVKKEVESQPTASSKAGLTCYRATSKANQISMLADDEADEMIYTEQDQRSGGVYPLIDRE